MSKIIVCLGYHLNPDSSIHPILENRLRDSMTEISKNSDSTLMLMGSSLYREINSSKISEAEVMNRYIRDNFGESLEDTEIVIEENSMSTVEQLCFLKEKIENISDLVIVSSQFFVNRVKLYAEYVFGTTGGITFIESKIPDDIKEKFREVEADKFTKAAEWLKGHKKGDFKIILQEQRAFQDKVKVGKVNHSVS